MTVVTALRPPTRSARKPKGDGHLRRGEILAAAERIFVAEGYDGATMRRIAEEVGVSSTALYMHFPDKGQMLLEICEAAIGRLLAVNTELAATPMCPALQVRRMLEAYLTFARENPNAYQVVFCSGATTMAKAREQGVAELSARCFEPFQGAVAKIEAAGMLKHGDAKAAAQTMWAACHGLAALLVTRPTMDWAAVPVLEATLLDGLFDGLVDPAARC